MSSPRKCEWNCNNDANPGQSLCYSCYAIYTEYSQSQRSQGRTDDLLSENASFEEIIQWETNQNNKNKRSNADIISVLPTSKKAKDAKAKDTKEEESCPICLDTFEEGEELMTTPCFHKFHENCLSKWMNESSKCPTCSTDARESLKMTA